MIRVGECNHCGDCCGGCPHLFWRAMRNIREGEVINSPVDVQSQCKVHNDPFRKEEFQKRGCHTFPDSPASTPERCSYRWSE